MRARVRDPAPLLSRLVGLCLGEIVIAAILRNIVEADPDPTDVTRRVGCAAQADDRVHLAPDAADAVRKPDLHWPMPGASFELIQTTCNGRAASNCRQR